MYNFCPACGTRVQRDWNFCENCGRRLLPVAGESTRGPAPAAQAVASGVASDAVAEPVTGAPGHEVQVTHPAGAEQSTLPDAATEAAAPQAAPLDAAGAASEQTPAQSAPPVFAPPVAVAPLRNRLALERVAILMLLSNGLYAFYWLYLTWKQYRDRTGARAEPVWHALTLMVPVYGLFRVHAHARAYRDLMLREGLPTSISPGRTVLAMLAIQALGVVGLGLSMRPPAQENVTAMFGIGGLSLVLMAWLLAGLQRNLNAYWANVAGDGLRDAPTGIGEVILAFLGILLWLDALDMSSPSVFQDLTTDIR